MSYQYNYQNKSRPSMNLLELATFRTSLCTSKADSTKCCNGENCNFSHCISWTRRNPYLYAYRSALCPNTCFWQEYQKMRVKTWCKRGRYCLFSHTKEEQMYHPEVYKTQLCKQYPNCNKPYCPFAHGIKDLRMPEFLLCFRSLEGPEKLEQDMVNAIGYENVIKKFMKPAKSIQTYEGLEKLKKYVKNMFENSSMAMLGLIYQSTDSFHISVFNNESIKIMFDGVIASKVYKLDDHIG